VHHPRVADWFMDQCVDGWATGPITENGFIRILGHVNYPEGPKSTDATRELLSALCSQPGHQFWSDAISLRDSDKYSSLPISKHITDYYLLACAIENHAQLATLDQRIDPSVITGGDAALCLIA
jgi:predicted nucleic acid-binding protein